MDRTREGQKRPTIKRARKKGGGQARISNQEPCRKKQCLFLEAPNPSSGPGQTAKGFRVYHGRMETHHTDFQMLLLCKRKPR